MATGWPSASGEQFCSAMTTPRSSLGNRSTSVKGGLQVPQAAGLPRPRLLERTG